MARLTITLSDERHQALKEAAVRRHTTIGKIIEDSLDRAGIKSDEDALALLRRAQARAALTGDEALALAVDEVRAMRREAGIS